MLLKMYRCYGNGRDNIHLGAVGIQVLTRKIKSALSLTDTRSYAYVGDHKCDHFIIGTCTFTLHLS